ncbi:lycopene beta-cyclase CrtY [Phenylobacterium sp.]|jgi:lycopene beta-cyclase|uniref:lycopene beta-cyclase CrtY n=1 Tax=Phenylobacterium sp. TaxID=1871053 RepID=UPI00378492F7
MGSNSPTPVCDVLLVGGGLANSLIALRLQRERPDLRLRMLDAEEPGASPKTWSVFRSDLEADAWTALAPAFEADWPGYEVLFPAHARRLSTPYASLTSPRLAQLAGAVLGPAVETGRRVVTITPDRVVCEDGETIVARVVIDGRGAVPSPHVTLGFQKFLGLEVSLRRPHGLTAPIVMDATVHQEDGYRFLYILPLDASRLLVEDTRYSDGPDLDVAQLEAAALRYARGKGWAVAEVLRRERGVLPVVLSGDVDAYFAEPGREAPQAGMRGLFFHPTTGYSLPDAARTAAFVARQPLNSSAELARALTGEAKRLWRERGFYRTLNRMLFRAAEPELRYRVLERFYRLPQPLIERFYAGQSTWADKVRILAGRPPVPLGRALAALPA